MEARVSDLPKAVWSGTFRVYDVDLKCHTLDNGQRIIEADSMAEFLEAIGFGEAGSDFDDFVRWQKG